MRPYNLVLKRKPLGYSMGRYMVPVLGRYALLQVADERGYKSELRQTLQNVEVLTADKLELSKKLEQLKRKVLGWEHTKAKLASLSDGAKDNLLAVKTVFPFVLVTDTLKIDRQKITIVHNDFLWTSHTASIKLRDIGNVQADIGPLFGSITVTSKHFLNNTQTLRYLKRKDAIMAQRLLQGFMIAHEAQIDTDGITSHELGTLLSNLGQENL